MIIRIYRTKEEIGAAAAAHGATLLRDAITAQGFANMIVATGASQFEMLAALAKEPGIAWNRVNGFHLDEYAGLPITHSASFRSYLWKRFVSVLPLPMKDFNWINGEGDCAAECHRLSELIRACPIDVAFVGIGENGHLAFNDPPADFETTDPFIVVELEEQCRRQQLGEGWFKALADVPRHAISMSIRQIMDSRAIVCTVPDERKAAAVRGAVEGDTSPTVPASILQLHPSATMFIDHASASHLRCQWRDSEWTSNFFSYCEMRIECTSRAYDDPPGIQPDRYARCQYLDAVAGSGMCPVFASTSSGLPVRYETFAR
jgi:glucosamine-6-phosphate deaminase